MRAVLAVSSMLFLSIGILAAGARSAEPGHGSGEALFERRCARCHGMAGDGGEGLAPALTGVAGRAVASRTDYPYTAALKAKGGVWTPEQLDAYITDPQTFAPGSEMDSRSPDPNERQALIAYLKTLR